MSRLYPGILYLFSACAAPGTTPFIPPPEADGAGNLREVETEPPSARRVVPVQFEVARPATHAAQFAGARPGPPSLRKQLRETRAPHLRTVDEESLRGVVDRVRALTGLPLLVSSAAQDACFDEGIVFDLDLANSMRVIDVLNLIEEEAGGAVRWRIQHAAVIFSEAEKTLSGGRVTRMYDIRALTFARTDFIGPRIDRLRLLDELEDDDGGGPFGGLGERVSQVTPEEVMDLIREQVAPRTWSLDGVSLDHAQGLLIVVHSFEVQGRVRRFLRQLGAF